MAKVKLNKSSLAHERTQLVLFKKLMPSLDLKRRQLTIELEKAKKAQEESRTAVGQLAARIGAELPMIARTPINLTELVRMTGVELDQENVVGVKLPRLRSIQCDVAEYSLLAKPAWVDLLVKRLRDAAEAHIRQRVAEQRVKVLEHAVRRVTQRVNLFGRILIPDAQQNIRRIRVYLGDLEREAVVRSKQAKTKNQPKAQAEPGGST